MGFTDRGGLVDAHDDQTNAEDLRITPNVTEVHMPLLDPTEDAIWRRPLPKAYIKSPNAIAKWIDDTVPCAVMPQSKEVTLAVLRHLRSSGVSEANIAASFAKSVYQ